MISSCCYYLLFVLLHSVKADISTSHDYKNLIIDSVWNASSSNSKLQIHIPKNLTRTGGYDHRDALFGTPEYGGSIQQKLYYADSEMCDYDDSAAQGGYPERNPKEAWKAPYILMVERGDCSFVQKVRNAQKVGAAGVIIADNRCKCFHGDDCQPDVQDELCEAREPLMADDGSGSDITIPAFLMFKQDADPIIAELKKNHMVRLEMAWSRLNPQDRVEYELWDVVDDPRTNAFAKEFKKAALALGEHARFTPHLVVFDGIATGCHSETDPEGGNDVEQVDDDLMEEVMVEVCQDMCTNQGRYCSAPPDGEDSTITGRDIVRESLRRECIWYLYGHDNGIGEEWWNYVATFNERCNNPEFFNNMDCIADSMKVANVDHEEVIDCEQQTGGYEDDKQNLLLQLQMDLIELSGVIILPAAFVNKEELRGSIEFATIFMAVCAGFTEGSEPLICNQCALCLSEEYECVMNKGRCPSDQMKTAVSSHVFVITLASTVMLLGTVGFMLYLRNQMQMKHQVRGLVAEYMPVNSKQGQGGTNGLFEYDDDDDNNGTQFS